MSARMAAELLLVSTGQEGAEEGRQAGQRRDNPGLEAEAAGLLEPYGARKRADYSRRMTDRETVERCVVLPESSWRPLSGGRGAQGRGRAPRGDPTLSTRQPPAPSRGGRPSTLAACAEFRTSSPASGPVCPALHGTRPRRALVSPSSSPRGSEKASRLTTLNSARDGLR